MMKVKKCKKNEQIQEKRQKFVVQNSNTEKETEIQGKILKYGKETEMRGKKMKSGERNWNMGNRLKYMERNWNRGKTEIPGKKMKYDEIN